MLVKWAIQILRPWCLSEFGLAVDFVTHAHVRSVPSREHHTIARDMAEVGRRGRASRLLQRSVILATAAWPSLKGEMIATDHPSFTSEMASSALTSHFALEVSMRHFSRQRVRCMHAGSMGLVLIVLVADHSEETKHLSQLERRST